MSIVSLSQVWYNLYIGNNIEVDYNMSDFEPKKLAILRILQILSNYSDYNHPLKQEDIASYLKIEYGIDLFSFNEKHKWVYCCRVDRITNVKIVDKPATDIHTIPGFKNGIDYKRFATSMPYMYMDEPQIIELLIDDDILDQVIDWFGKDITITKDNDDKCLVKITASPNAMVLWAMQYASYVEVVSPLELRKKIADIISQISEKYKK